MKKIKQTTPYFWAMILVLIFLLSACDGDPVQIQGQVQVIYGDQVLVDNTVHVYKGDTVRTAVMIACQERNLPYIYTNGVFDGFGGHASTDTAGWLLYLNGELIDLGADNEVGAGDLKLENGFHLLFSYLNYDDALTE